MVRRLEHVVGTADERKAAPMGGYHGGAELNGAAGGTRKLVTSRP